MEKKSGYIHWTNDRKELLRELYPYNGNKKLAKLFGVEVKNIESVAVRMRLLKTKETKSKLHSKTYVKRTKKPIITMATGHIMIYMPNHPNCDSRGYIGEHRYVMEQKLSRYLEADEIVLHKNKDNGDNREENLELKHHYRSDVSPLQIYLDRKSGMEVKEIMNKYNICINTYYRKLKKGKNRILEMGSKSVR